MSSVDSLSRPTAGPPRFFAGALALCAALVLTAGCLGGKDPVGALPKGGHHVLFIGNSLTYVNDLPGTLARLAASAGDTVVAAEVAEPDYALLDHLMSGDALAAIGQGGWEYVILQQGPSSLQVNRDSLILWTEAFDPFIRQVGAVPALYMVWPSVDRLAFFDDVRISYQQAADSVDGLFIPAGQAWLTAWAKDPTLAFYSADGFHPTPLATYLVALVMYERITGHDARDLPGQAVVAGHTLGVPEATVRLLQNAAHDTNAQFPIR